MDMIKLHIGGEEKKDGWKILNIQKKPDVDYVGDISDLSQFEDNSIQEIYASHVFEHIRRKNITKTILGIYRVLKPSGKFHVSVPDMDVLFKLFLNPDTDGKRAIHILGMIFGGQMDDFDIHYFGWNFKLLKGTLQANGFKKIEKVKSFNLFNDTSEYNPYGVPISLNLTAEK
jgi:predicted SAM-dependent methyltransferase